MPTSTDSSDHWATRLEWVFPAAILWSACALSGAPLGLFSFVLLAALWPLATLGLEIVPGGRQLPRWLALVAESFLPLPFGWMVQRLGFTPVSLALLAGVGGSSLFARSAWRVWLRLAARPGVESRAEGIRLLLVGGAALWVIQPFFTDRLLGGVDARWYASMFADFREQLWHGGLPVFVGQGEFAFNGAIHPFRSAPAYLYQAGIWDVLTCHRLAVPALQHLVVVGNSLAGAWGMYVALVWLVPARRWIATGSAILFASAPAILFTIYSADMYMTFTTVAVLPWIFYGNARLFQLNRGHGYVVLAAALAAIWACHPPIAVYCSLLTLFIQGGRLVVSADPVAEWRWAVPAGGLGLALSAFYFYSMSERPPLPQRFSLGRDALQMGGALLGCTAIIRSLILRNPRWLLLVLPAAALLWWSQPAWLLWLFASVGFALVVWFFPGTPHWLKRESGQWLIPTFAILAGGFLVARVLVGFGPDFAPKNGIIDGNTRLWLNYFLPVSSEAVQPSDCQTGWALTVAGLVGLLLAFWRGTWTLRIVSSAAVLGVATFWKLPGFSSFWVGYFPAALADIVSLPLVLRLMPVLATLLTLLGFLGLSRLCDLRPGLERAVLIALALATGWSLVEARKFVQRGRAVTSTRLATQNYFIPENRDLNRVAYDLLKISPYHTYGAIDYRLESRLLNADGSLREGPRQVAEKMEQLSDRVVVWSGSEMTGAPAWLELSPRLELVAGETVLLRFEFFDHPYDGYLIMKNDRIYREYALPRSGQPLAFGTLPAASRVMTLTNSSNATAVISSFFVRNGSSGFETAPKDFARVHLSPFHPEKLSVRVRSLIPYLADATLSAAGFLESPRIFLPGYRAEVDGKATAVSRSPNGLVMVPVSNGEHLVKITFSGTARLWMAWWLSLLSWGGVLIFALINLRRAWLARDAASARSLR